MTVASNQGCVFNNSGPELRNRISNTVPVHPQAAREETLLCLDELFFFFCHLKLDLLKQFKLFTESIYHPSLFSLRISHVLPK